MIEPTTNQKAYYSPDDDRIWVISNGENFGNRQPPFTASHAASLRARRRLQTARIDVKLRQDVADTMERRSVFSECKKRECPKIDGLICVSWVISKLDTLRLSLKRRIYGRGQDCIKDDGPIRIRLKSNAVEESRVGIALTWLKELKLLSPEWTQE